MEQHDRVASVQFRVDRLRFDDRPVEHRAMDVDADHVQLVEATLHLAQ